MSSDNLTSKSNVIPSNEDVINDLTKDLETQSIQNPEVKDRNGKINETNEAGDRSGNEPPLEPNTPEEFNDDAPNDDSSETNCLEEDYVDEELLKDLEVTLSEEEKTTRKNEANILKQRGNEEHKNGNYVDSIITYTEALRLCPLGFSDDRAILYANRAASKISVARQKSAIDDCSKAIELNPIYIRAYLRRAKLYEESEKYDESLEDFKKILELDPSVNDARSGCARLPPLITERNEKLKTEMFGKLKDLGNMILKPFGLSTENFQLNQDPNSGGYSVNFSQNVKK